MSCKGSYIILIGHKSCAIWLVVRLTITIVTWAVAVHWVVTFDSLVFFLVQWKFLVWNVFRRILCVIFFLPPSFSKFTSFIFLSPRNCLSTTTLLLISFLFSGPFNVFPWAYKKRLLHLLPNDEMLQEEDKKWEKSFIHFLHTKRKSFQEAQGLQ